MLLTQDEVVEFTGFSHSARQSEWLSKCLIGHQYPNGKGKVAVTWEQVNNPRHRTEEPNFEKVA